MFASTLVPLLATARSQKTAILSLLLATFALAQSTASAATLNAGDIVVVGHNSLPNPESITFMNLVSLPAGTVVKMSDATWLSAGGWGTSIVSEGWLTWTPAATVPAGTIFRISRLSGGPSFTFTNVTTGAVLTPTPGATSGQLFFTGWTTATTILNNGGDSFFFYQDADTNPFFISGFINTSVGGPLANGWYAGVVDGNTAFSALPVAGTGNQNGVNVGTAPFNDGEAGTNGLSLWNFMSTTYFGNVQYNGPTTAADRNTWLSRIMTASNWIGNNDATTPPTGSLGTSASISSVSTTTVTSLNRVNATPSNAGTVNWTLTFASAVTGVTASNFSLSGAAATGASVGNPSTSNGGLTWNVPVNTGSTDGTLTLNLANALGLSPSITTSLPFTTAGQEYTMDKTAPTIGIGAPSVSTIVAGAGSVTYTVTYADTNFNGSTLANGNITLNTTGTASGTVNVTGSGLTRTVTISSITGAGTLGISIASGTATDTAGNIAAAAGPSTTFTVTAPAPVVSSVSSLNANTAYRAGQLVSIQVTFNTSVTVTGTPTLALNTGGVAGYSFGGPGTTLNFNYAVGAGQTASDLDYAATNSLTGTINATSGGTPATLTLPSPGAAGSLGANNAIIIDTTAPTIGIGSPSVSSINAGAGSVTYTVTYADTNFNSSTLANGNITLNTTGTANGSVNVTGSGLTRTVTISSITGAGTLGISIASGTASDTAGNTAAAAGPSTTFTVLGLPGAPTIGTATAGNANASVTFTAPASDGGSAITSYTVTSSPSGITGTGAASPITVNGLTNGTPYTFTVKATNGVGPGPDSAPSNSVTPMAPPSADIPITIGAGGALTIDATGSAGAADTKVSIVDLGGGVFVLEITDPNRTIGAPAGGNQVDSHTVQIPIGLVGNIVINGTSLGDTFTLDLSAGSPLPGGITVNGNLPTSSPGDSLRVIGAYDDITYGPNGIGSGNLNVDGTLVAFTGLEPLDFSGAAVLNLTVQVDPLSTFAGDVITTIASVDAGVNTEITFADNAGVPNGLESIKIGALTGTLTIEGDNAANDFFKLQGLGSAMAGHVSIDGLGGNADVIEVYNATFAVTGTNKNLSLTADFIGLTQTQSADTTPDDPGILRATGNITLEANGDDTVTTPPLWGSSGVWGGALPAYYNATTFATRGNILNMGHIEKTAGSDATLTLRANRHVMIPLAGASGNTAGRIVSTNNKLHTIINSDRDALNGGPVSITTFAQVLTNGGDLTIGGGATPATTAAKGVTGTVSGVAIQGATVNSSGGNISIRGTGADAANGVGVLINSTSLKNSVAISSGAGNITITGLGGNGTNGHGFRLAGDTSLPTPGSATIQTTTGTITVAGTAVIATGIGIISSSNTSTSSTGGAAVSFTGISPGTQAFQMNPISPGTAVVNSTNGTVTIAADTMHLNANTGTESITAGTGTVTLKPTTAGKNIALGSGVTDNGSLLAIDSSLELSNITAATVNIGDATSGTLTVSSVISPATFTTLGLASGSGTTFTNTSGFTADVTTASNYEKITVTGTVSLTAGPAFTANAAGGYVWNGTDSFVFLANDSTDAITGTFTGPTLTNFLGSTLTATQSYTTGTGNDFGTGIAVANNANLANLQLKSGSTTHVLTPVFAAGTTSYTLDLPNQTISAQINATVADSAATPELSINGRPFTTLTSGSFTGAISLNTGGNTFAVRVTAPDMVTQKTYTVTITRAPLPPLFLGQTASTGGGTGGGTIDAPNGDATSSLGKWESIRQGAVMSNSGALAFRGHMEVGSGTPPVTVNDFQGIWKYDTVDTRLKARSGSAAPETGGALFDMLPLNPAISPSGFISFYGSLRMGTGIPEVTAADNQGLWSELGGGTLRLVLREGDNVPGTSVAKTFRSGFAVTSSSANTLAINARLSSGTALLHLDVSAPATVVTVVAEEGQAAPGGGTWVALDGNSSDPRLSPSGGLGFIGWELVGTAHIQGIYSRSGGTPPGTPGVVLDARVGSSAPGTGGATFRAFERPTVFDGGIAFRGFLNQDGDNAGGTRGQGIWYRDGGALAPVIRTGDGNAEVSSIPVGSTVTSVWSPFSNSQSTIAYRVGLSNGVTETRAIMTTSSTSTDIVAMVGDAAPGLPGETFTNFDHPVIGDRDHVAFTASTNAGSYGLWRSHFDSGAFRLVLKVGDSINTSQGVKTIAGISLPGATTDDRKFESVCLDDNGNILVHITFSDGSTSLLLGQ